MNSSNTKMGFRDIVMIIAIGLPYFFSNFHRYSLAIIGSSITADFGLTPEQLGLLGSVFLYTYAALQIPCGLIADKISAKKMLVFSCILAAASTIIFSLSKDFTGVVIARALTGVATALVYVPAMALIRTQFGDAIYGTLVGIIVALGKAGQVCATAPLKFLDDWIGWRTTFVIIAGCTLLIAVFAVFMIVEPKKDVDALAGKKGPRDIRGLATFGAISIMIWFYITGGTRLSFQSLWAGRYYTEGLGVSATQSSMFLTAASVGCIFGSVIFGRMADRIGSIRTLFINTILFCLTWVGYMMVRSESSAAWSLILGAALGLVGAGGFAVGFSCIRAFVSKESTGLATGFNNFFAFLGSAMFTQFSTKIMGLTDGTLMEQFAGLFRVFTGLSVLALVLITVSNWKRIAGRE